MMCTQLTEDNPMHIRSATHKLNDSCADSGSSAVKNAHTIKAVPTAFLGPTLSDSNPVGIEAAK